MFRGISSAVMAGDITSTGKATGCLYILFKYKTLVMIW